MIRFHLTRKWLAFEKQKMLYVVVSLSLSLSLYELTHRQLRTHSPAGRPFGMRT
jgi:hypothetical protein